MALVGVNVTFGYCNGFLDGKNQVGLPYGATSSQVMATAATSTISAPIGTIAPASQILLPMLSISASAPIFYSVGPTPNISTDALRYYDPSFGREDILVNAGDKVAWTFA